MKNSISVNFFNCINLTFFLIAIAEAALIWISSLSSLVELVRVPQSIEREYHNIFILNSFKSGYFVSFIPIVAVLPFSGRYVDDVRNKFAMLFLIRTDYTTYLISHVVGCFLLGGAVVATGSLLAWFASILCFLPLEKWTGEPSESTVLIKVLILLFLNGGLWAVVGMAMSTVMESKYIAYCAPFVIYYLLVILHERYFLNNFLLYPGEWIAPSSLWPIGFGGPAILMIELTILFALIFVFRAGRRLREL